MSRIVVISHRHHRGFTDYTEIYGSKISRVNEAFNEIEYGKFMRNLLPLDVVHVDEKKKNQTTRDRSARNNIL